MSGFNTEVADSVGEALAAHQEALGVLGPWLSSMATRLAVAWPSGQSITRAYQEASSNARGQGQFAGSLHRQNAAAVTIANCQDYSALVIGFILAASAFWQMVTLELGEVAEAEAAKAALAKLAAEAAERAAANGAEESAAREFAARLITPLREFAGKAWLVGKQMFTPELRPEMGTLMRTVMVVEKPVMAVQGGIATVLGEKASGQPVDWATVGEATLGSVVAFAGGDLTVRGAGEWLDGKLGSAQGWLQSRTDGVALRLRTVFGVDLSGADVEGRWASRWSSEARARAGSWIDAGAGGVSTGIRVFRRGLTPVAMGAVGAVGGAVAGGGAQLAQDLRGHQRLTAALVTHTLFGSMGTNVYAGIAGAMFQAAHSVWHSGNAGPFDVNAVVDAATRQLAEGLHTGETVVLAPDVGGPRELMWETRDGQPVGFTSSSLGNLSDDFGGYVRQVQADRGPVAALKVVLRARMVSPEALQAHLAAIGGTPPATATGPDAATGPVTADRIADAVMLALFPPAGIHWAQARDAVVASYRDTAGNPPTAAARPDSAPGPAAAAETAPPAAAVPAEATAPPVAGTGTDAPVRAPAGAAAPAEVRQAVDQFRRVWNPELVGGADGVGPERIAGILNAMERVAARPDAASVARLVGVADGLGGGGTVGTAAVRRAVVAEATTAALTPAVTVPEAGAASALARRLGQSDDQTTVAGYLLNREPVAEASARLQAAAAAPDLANGAVSARPPDGADIEVRADDRVSDNVRADVSDCLDWIDARLALWNGDLPEGIGPPEAEGGPPRTVGTMRRLPRFAGDGMPRMLRDHVGPEQVIARLRDNEAAAFLVRAVGPDGAAGKWHAFAVTRHGDEYLAADSTHNYEYVHDQAHGSSALPLPEIADGARLETAAMLYTYDAHPDDPALDPRLQPAPTRLDDVTDAAALDDNDPIRGLRGGWSWDPTETDDGRELRIHVAGGGATVVELPISMAAILLRHPTSFDVRPDLLERTGGLNGLGGLVDAAKETRGLLLRIGEHARVDVRIVVDRTRRGGGDFADHQVTQFEASVRRLVLGDADDAGRPSNDGSGRGGSGGGGGGVLARWRELHESAKSSGPGSGGRARASGSGAGSRGSGSAAGGGGDSRLARFGKGWADLHARASSGSKGVPRGSAVAASPGDSAVAVPTARAPLADNARIAATIDVLHELDPAGDHVRWERQEAGGWTAVADGIRPAPADPKQPDTAAMRFVLVPRGGGRAVALWEGDRGGGIPTWQGQLFGEMWAGMHDGVAHVVVSVDNSIGADSVVAQLRQAVQEFAPNADGLLRNVDLNSTAAPYPDQVPGALGIPRNDTPEPPPRGGGRPGRSATGRRATSGPTVSDPRSRYGVPRRYSAGARGTGLPATDADPLLGYGGAPGRYRDPTYRDPTYRDPAYRSSADEAAGEEPWQIGFATRDDHAAGAYSDAGTYAAGGGLPPPDRLGFDEEPAVIPSQPVDRYSAETALTDMRQVADGVGELASGDGYSVTAGQFEAAAGGVLVSESGGLRAMITRIRHDQTRVSDNYGGEIWPRRGAALALVSGRVYGVRGGIGDVVVPIPERYRSTGMWLVNGGDTYRIVQERYTSNIHYLALTADGTNMYELPGDAGHAVYYSGALGARLSPDEPVGNSVLGELLDRPSAQAALDDIGRITVGVGSLPPWHDSPYVTRAEVERAVGRPMVMETGGLTAVIGDVRLANAAGGGDTSAALVQYPDGVVSVRPHGADDGPFSYDYRELSTGLCIVDQTGTYAILWGETEDDDFQVLSTEPRSEIMDLGVFLASEEGPLDPAGPCYVVRFSVDRGDQFASPVEPDGFGGDYDDGSQGGWQPMEYVSPVPAEAGAENAAAPHGSVVWVRDGDPWLTADEEPENATHARETVEPSGLSAVIQTFRQANPHGLAMVLVDGENYEIRRADSGDLVLANTDGDAFEVVATPDGERLALPDGRLVDLDNAPVATGGGPLNPATECYVAYYAPAADGTNWTLLDPDSIAVSPRKWTDQE
jgi:hypothetical protein